MTDKKLTDNEIIKALECCISNTDEDCNKCVCSGSNVSCVDILLQNALDLINRQKEDLIDKEKQLQEALKRMAVNKTKVIDLEKEINYLQAENERLNNLTLEKCCDNCIHEEKTLQADPCCECFGHNKFTPKNFLNHIKAEAYKECIEKVKENSNKMDLVCSGALVQRDYTITEQNLDNLLKELVGENK